MLISKWSRQILEIGPDQEICASEENGTVLENRATINKASITPACHACGR